MPERLAKILDGLVDGAGETIKMCGLLPLWQQVVDERVGSRTEPIKIKDRTLYVSTASPAWAQELNFLKREIIIKFNRLAGQEVINNIKFSAKGGSAVSGKSGGYNV